LEGLKPIERTKLSHTVMARIKALIASGEYPPGQRLPTEKELAEAFGVSRMSVREALSALAAAGLIEVRHGEGSFVRRVDVTHYLPPIAASLAGFPEAALQLLEVRSILEAGAAELAAQRADDTALQELEAAAMAYRSQVEAQETGLEGDLRLHRAIANAAGNPVLTELMNRISDLIAQGMAYTLGQNAGDPEQARQVADEHDDIVAAIRRRDPAAARAAMLRHLANVRAKVVRRIREARTGEEAKGHA
jgi:GntR family transcriptional repressor for pyruvate dehydrogenase complex